MSSPFLPRAASRAGALLLLACAAAACGGEPTKPAARATTIEIVTGAPATGTAGVALATAPTFVVKDQNGAPMAGVPVTITTSIGGSVSGGPASTLAESPTPVGSWTLAPQVGTNTLTIAVEGITPDTITVQGVAGPAESITTVSGDGQSAAAGTPLAQPVVFVAADRFGNPVSGAAVAIAVTGGGDVAIPATDAQGRASVTWTLGTSAIPQTLQAEVGGSTASATATVQTSFDLEVRFAGPAMAASHRTAFEAAAARVRAMVVGDLQNATTGGALDLATACRNPDLPTVNEIVDDLVIYASARPIDGAGGVLGRAGPCIIRGTGSVLPVYGTMEFDSADLDRMAGEGTLVSVILHEMLHVVGVGTYWEYRGLLVNEGQATVGFTGAHAREQCLAEGGGTTCTSLVPVESEGGDGTANSHWRESVFDTELMTGWENARVENGRTIPLPLSRMTIGSLWDIGYTVNYGAADVYRVSPTSTASLLRGVRRPSTQLREATMVLPRFRLGHDGRLTPMTVPWWTTPTTPPER